MCAVLLLVLAFLGGSWPCPKTMATQDSPEIYLGSQKWYPGALRAASGASGGALKKFRHRLGDSVQDFGPNSAKKGTHNGEKTIKSRSNDMKK